MGAPLRQGAGHTGLRGFTSYTVIPPKGPTQGWSQSVFGLWNWGPMSFIPCGRCRHGSQPAVPEMGPAELGAGL